MKRLKQPVMKPPRGYAYKFSVDGYTFERPTLEGLIDAVFYYKLDSDNTIDRTALAAQIEDSVCQQNLHMPQHERN